MTNPEAPQRKPRCQHLTKSGQRCHADPQTGKDWCFLHDPEKKQKQAEAQKHGGEARTRQIEPELIVPPNLPEIRLRKSGDVVDLMAETIHHLQCRKMDVRIAQVLAYLASLVLRALKAGRSMEAHLLSDTIDQVRQGETDLRTAKTIGHLTSVILIALKQEAEEAQAQAAMEAEPTPRPTGARRIDAATLAGIEKVMTAIRATKPPDHHNVHPAALAGPNAGANGVANASAASQPLSS